MTTIISRLIAGFFIWVVVMGTANLIMGWGPKDYSHTPSDKELIAEGNARIEAFCASKPDKC